ncbi:YcxB family protein [Echinicola shivajiensis]|uniref:YcxB family protein n=1 Tax=Echinicola shivajiensis TaxID=1035916 RepID=UPI001BFC6E73|nr:YcxB family protein [Echinicola shivajiensis]
MIKTKNFSLSEREFFEIIATNRLKKFWWLYLISFIIGLSNLNSFGGDKFSTALVIFGLTFPPFIFLHLFYWVKSSKNASLFNEMSMTFSEEMISLSMSNGNYSEVPWDQIMEIKKRRNYWLLYISSNQFLFLKKEAFDSIEDFEKFELLTIEKFTKS